MRPQTYRGNHGCIAVSITMPLVVRQASWQSQSNSNTDLYPSDALPEYSSSIPPTYYTPPPCKRSNVRTAKFQDDAHTEKKEYQQNASPWSSHDPYAFSTSSIDDSYDELPPFEILDYDSQSTIPSVFAATPQQFADYFPSMHRMSIKHDDTTDDGNMNLRIDTVAPSSTEWKPELTLFHLRMYDLKHRSFSLRRYCRDSGKEICHSRRQFLKPSVVRRPLLQRSVSNALSNLRPNSRDKTPKVPAQRKDSGCDSMSDEEDEETLALESPSRVDDLTSPSNTITFEFSNYAHLELKRRGSKSSKRYDFEYWGTKYAWKRAIIRSGSFNETSYHLVDNSSHNAVAHIVPVPLSNAESKEEEAKGGWVVSRSTPCCLSGLTLFAGGYHPAQCGSVKRTSSTDQQTLQSRRFFLSMVIYH